MIKHEKSNWVSEHVGKCEHWAVNAQTNMYAMRPACIFIFNVYKSTFFFHISHEWEVWAIELFPNVATVLWPSGIVECINGVWHRVSEWAGERTNERASWASEQASKRVYVYLKSMFFNRNASIVWSQLNDLIDIIECTQNEYIQKQQRQVAFFHSLSLAWFILATVFGAFDPTNCERRRTRMWKGQNKRASCWKSAMINKDAMHLHEHIVG